VSLHVVPIDIAATPDDHVVTDAAGHGVRDRPALDNRAVATRIRPDHAEPTDHPDHPAGHARGLEPEYGTAIRTISTSIRPALTPLATPDGGHRPTPFESGLAAVARQDVHIERVWPMRSPSTGPLGESSSALSQVDQSGTPPASIVPVEGLRMSQESSPQESSPQGFAHQPVMTAEVVAQFAPVPSGLVLDATVGGGGHAAALLRAYPGINILGIDRDPMAVVAATEALAPFGSRATVRRSRFDALSRVVAEVLGEDIPGGDIPGRGVPGGGVPGREVPEGPDEAAGSNQPRLSGVLFDLGVSSPQLDVAGRGFSYRRDAPLDMRMDPTSGRTAADVVNEYAEDALVQIFGDNGEGRFAPRIARAIIAARPLATTGQLADVVRAAIPAATRRTGGHPARRVFQAIRIAVNEELDQLATALEVALDLLAPGGRCVVIAYHSGEDRLVKSLFFSKSTDDCRCPPGLPCVCGADPQFRLVTRGARRPTSDEIEHNRRAEAARLRVIERLPHPSGPESDPSGPTATRGDVA
jgi:16S rRNA (cytosine1402-N4)-methyltransferase